jgi:chemotaxis protein histidine kinase CheA
MRTIRNLDSLFHVMRNKSYKLIREQELDALFDITLECERLKEIKDIMDQLQIIANVNECQEAVLSKLRDIIKEQNPTPKPKDAVHERAAAVDHREEESRAEGSQAEGSYPSAVQGAIEEQNQASKAKDDKGKAVATEEQEERFQASSADLVAAEDLVLQSKARKASVNELYKSADRAYGAVSNSNLLTVQILSIYRSPTYLN